VYHEKNREKHCEPAARRRRENPAKEEIFPSPKTIEVEAIASRRIDEIARMM
jgi:hypothetical protein